MDRRRVPRQAALKAKELITAQLEKTKADLSGRTKTKAVTGQPLLARAPALQVLPVLFSPRSFHSSVSTPASPPQLLPELDNEDPSASSNIEDDDAGSDPAPQLSRWDDDDDLPAAANLQAPLSPLIKVEPTEDDAGSVTAPQLRRWDDDDDLPAAANLQAPLSPLIKVEPAEDDAGSDRENRMATEPLPQLRRHSDNDDPAPFEMAYKEKEEKEATPTCFVGPR